MELKLKDHQIAALVNAITSEIQPICDNQSVRSRVSRVVRRFLVEQPKTLYTAYMAGDFICQNGDGYNRAQINCGTPMFFESVTDIMDCVRNHFPETDWKDWDISPVIISMDPGVESGSVS